HLHDPPQYVDQIRAQMTGLLPRAPSSHASHLVIDELGHVHLIHLLLINHLTTSIGVCAFSFCPADAWFVVLALILETSSGKSYHMRHPMIVTPLRKA